MTTRLWIPFLLGSCVATAAFAQQPPDTSAKYKALACPTPAQDTTWAILDRNGANRQVEPYLSSLGQGESGTGTISSPVFKLDTDTIRFTICGHDGQDGKRGENLIALVDARKNTDLRKTAAPANDALQERTWDVADLRGREVRIELRDGIAEGAFAWLGIGRIDAGLPLRVDFRGGLPDDWVATSRAADVRYDYVAGTVPFRRNAGIGGLIPARGAIEFPCGFVAARVFLLGCTVPTGRPLDCYGAVEFHYRSGTVDSLPLIYGFTLDGRNKLLSPSKAMYLRPSSDPFQHVLALAPRPEVIDTIRLVASSTDAIPLVTAITCETQDDHEHLVPLPKEQPSPEDTAWIATHTVTPQLPERHAIARELRKAHKLPAPEPGSAGASTRPGVP